MTSRTLRTCDISLGSLPALQAGDSVELIVLYPYNRIGTNVVVNKLKAIAAKLTYCMILGQLIYGCRWTAL